MTALAVQLFGDVEIQWPGWLGGDKDTHVMVATKGSAWSFICRATPRDYVTWSPTDSVPREVPTTVPLVWKYDRAKVTCEGCLAVLDGTVTWAEGATP